MPDNTLLLGIDVGSTTVKLVACDHSGLILYRDYQRHETRQRETLLSMLDALGRHFSSQQTYQTFITGSGGGALTGLVQARFVQEVNAVSLAVEHLYPEAGSVIELGGQDAKIIVFQKVDDDGRKRKLPSMNDKCAGGTGTVIDKIRAKLSLDENVAAQLPYDGLDIHPVAAKCGVFAETDINGLQKSGVPVEQLMASLYDAIVMQNLTVLTRGHTLKPQVILLGGPNFFYLGLQQAWRSHIPRIWEERDIDVLADVAIEELIKVPDDAQYFAALGAVLFGIDEGVKNRPKITLGQIKRESLLKFEVGKIRASGKGLAQTDDELENFTQAYQVDSQITDVPIEAGRLSAFLGLDCGSTSTKAVLLNQDGKLAASAYQLSSGNPIEDTQAVFSRLEALVADKGAELEISGCVTTGYAKDVLKGVLNADAAIVETVAHAYAAQHYYPDVDVICDVGGQDIKIMILKEGRIKDFRLNTQCSAGNGYFLQNTADALGISISDYADIAFKATDYPKFGYGCSVFMQSDIVDFQRQGWDSEQILAGLAAVLPKNIWLYVAQMPNLVSLGSKFLLQGGTQRNLAAVKAQVDFIQQRFEGSGVDADIQVHRYCGESGAIGAALEARRLCENSEKTSFIGMDRVQKLSYVTHHDDHTVCHFCSNECRRTFIDVSTGLNHPAQTEFAKSRIPVMDGQLRIISGNSCEKGLVEDTQAMRVIKEELDNTNRKNPNLSQWSAESLWKAIPNIELNQSRSTNLLRWKSRQPDNKPLRSNIRIGIPRVLNQYSINPLFSAYFQALGIKSGNLVYSKFTTESLYREGAKRASIDPCYPSKLANAHIHDLLYGQGKRKPINTLFFPMINSLDSPLWGTQASCACPTVTATPEVVKAAFTKERDLFEESAVQFLNPLLDIANPELFEQQMYDAFADVLRLERLEHNLAIEQGYKALKAYREKLRDKGRKVLRQVIDEDQIAIVLLARPYHNDPGINHGIPEQLQALGYPILTIDSLPLDEDILDELFADEIEQGIVESALAISDVWKNSYSENSNQKLWAAKYAARHPNLVALELSSFKCGHDAPVYTVMERIIEMTGTPYFCFKDLDENNPAGSIKIRLETIDYFLQRYRESQLPLWDKLKHMREELSRYVASLS